MRVVVCDRCGKEENANGGRYATFVMETSSYNIGGMVVFGGETRWDLCETCSEWVRNTLSKQDALAIV